MDARAEQSLVGIDIADTAHHGLVEQDCLDRRAPLFEPLCEFIERDFEQKIGAPVLENANYIYAGGADDNALNDGVKRYTASPAALAYLKTWYTPTGVLMRPTLAVHTTYDPIIPAETTALYADAVRRAASSDNFVQQYVKHDGHCNIGGPETGAALGELIRWKRTGVKPSAGLVPVADK